MAQFSLTHPVWVQYKDNKYHVRSLFFPEIRQANKRYERAILLLRQTIRKKFRSSVLEQQNKEQYLWLSFCPDIQFESLHLTFEYGQRFFQGKISVAKFVVKDMLVCLLPAFRNYMFISANRKQNQDNITEEIIEHIQSFARKEKKASGQDINLERYISGKGEFCTLIEFSMYVAEEKLSYGERHRFRYRAGKFQVNDFDGYREIEKVGQDLNELYPVNLERAYEIESMVENLYPQIYGERNIPVVLIGPPKVGKTALIHELVAHYIKKSDDIPFLRKDRIWHIDPVRIISGMSVIGMWQRRFEAIIDFAINNIKGSKRRDKLFFDNVIALFRVGKSSQNSLTLSDVLRPYLEKQQVQLILEATPEQWDLACEMDRSFTDLCEIVRIEPPTDRASIKILAQLRTELEREQAVKVSNPALAKLIEQSHRFGDTQAKIGMQCEQLKQLATKYSGQKVELSHVLEAFQSRTHLNERLADAAITVEKHEFANFIDERLIGQANAATCLSDVLHIIKAELSNPYKPLGSFLFIGPTGVGKTQAAKVLADYLFTHQDRLVRFDMNEFIDGGAVSRLVGDWRQPEGQLTSAVKYNPNCVLLLDEIEKAHPSVHDLLLQVLGEGRLTDSLGQTISFTRVVIIMTSNIGAERAGREIGLVENPVSRQQTYVQAVRHFFRPEFVNRIDKVVVFHALSKEDIAQVAQLQIQGLLNRHGFRRRHTILDMSPEVLADVAEKGYDPKMGGRALKRQIEKDLTAKIAEQLVLFPPNDPMIFRLDLSESGDLNPGITSLRHIPANPSLGLNLPQDQAVIQQAFQQLWEAYQVLKTRKDAQQEKRMEELLETMTESEALIAFHTEQREFDSDSETETGKHYRHLSFGQRLEQILVDLSLNLRIKISPSQVRVKVLSESVLGYPEDGRHLKDIYHKIQVKDYLSELAHASNWLASDAQRDLFAMTREFSQQAYDFDSEQEECLIVQKAVRPGSDKLMNPYSSLMWKGIFSHYAEPLGGAQGLNRYFILKGAGVEHMIRHEIGHHVLIEEDGTLYPIELHAYRLKPNQQESKKQKAHVLKEIREGSFFNTHASLAPHVKPSPSCSHIIRIYNFMGQDKKQGRITDLRTGLIFPLNPNASEIGLLTYTLFPGSHQFHLKYSHENS